MTQIVKQITESFVKRKSIHETNGGNLASKTGRAHRTRTCNPLIKSQLLCQIELAPHHFVAAVRNSNTYLVAVASSHPAWHKCTHHEV